MSLPQDLVRVIRVLEYVGPRQWVEHSLEKRHVKGTWRCNAGVIQEAIVGDFPEDVTPVADPVPLEPCPECKASSFRSASDRDRHLLKCRLTPMDMSEECAFCGHARSAHVYGDGPCRPGFPCMQGCEGFVAAPAPPSGDVEVDP